MLYDAFFLIISVSSSLMIEFSSLPRELISSLPFTKMSPDFAPVATLITFKPMCPCTIDHSHQKTLSAFFGHTVIDTC